MGRTRAKTKQPTLRHDTLAEKAQPSVDALLAKAQDLVVQCNYELALQFASRVLSRETNHADARELLGVCQLELGQIEDARKTFQTLVPPHPNAPKPPPPSAYLYLAQLQDGDPREALRCYQSAIDILYAQLKGKDRLPPDAAGSVTDERSTKNAIVRALIGMVEIWMDPEYDLCDAPEAEQTCEDLLFKAQQVDPGNSEALQALASVRMSQQRPDDAKECLEQAWSAWKDLELDDERMPAMETRLALVKLFLELSLFPQALQILHGVMSEDDQDVEAWYLEGWCFFLMAESAKESGTTVEELGWQELAQDARDCLETCQTLHVQQGHPDLPVLQHARELADQLTVLGIRPSTADEEPDDADNGEWENVSDDDDNEMMEA